jgi:septal ring factor EnvC (AmiA/AmiB activator)
MPSPDGNGHERAESLGSYRARLKELEQKADTLKTQEAELSEQVAAFNSEIEAHEREMNRLLVERGELERKIKTIRAQIESVEEEVFDNEAEIALAALQSPDEPD